MNGNVNYVDLKNLNYTFKDLKYMTDNLLKIYLTNLVTHGCSIPSFSDHFHVSRTAAINLFKRSGVTPKNGKVKAYREAFRDFVSGGSKNCVPTFEVSEPEVKNDSVVEDNLVSIPDVCAKVVSGNYTMIGTPAQIAEAFYKMAPAVTSMKVTITFDILEDN